MILTQYLTYQRYLITKESEKIEVIYELNSLKDRLKTSLNYDLSAAKTLAYIIENYGVPEDFNRVAKEILNSNKNIDVIEINRNGIITHAYPVKGYETAIGYNILTDSLRNKEAFKAIEKRELYFAGPFELKQGGLAVAGRLPIIINNSFWGFSTVIINLSTLVKTIGIDTSQNNRFIYQLSKINPNTKKEEFFLPGSVPINKKQSVSIEIPDGEWTLYVMPKDNKNFINIISFSIIGVLFSLICALFSWYITKQPEKLNKLVEEKTLQLAASEKHFRSLIENSSDAIVLLDDKGKVLYQSPSTERITGYSLKEIQALDGLELIHPDDQEKDFRAFNQIISSPDSTLHKNHRFKHKGGHYIWLEGTYTNLLNNENVKAIVFNYHDITQRVLSEQKANNAKRLYKVISRINQIMVHATNEQELFKEACEIAVDLGKFKLVWIGMLDDIEKKVIPVMYAGEGHNYLTKMNRITLNDTELSNGPTGRAIRNETYVLCNDIEHDPIMKPWAEEALAHEFRASIALPIKKFGKVVGTFNLYATVPHYFDAEEIAVLEETTGDISFTLENFEKEKMRKQAEEEVFIVNKDKITTLNRINDSIVTVDNEWRYTYLNDAALSTQPESKENTLGKIIWDVHPEMKGTIFWDTYHAAMQTGKIMEIESYYDPMKIWFSVKLYPSATGLTIFYNDISERKKAEVEIKQSQNELRQLSAHLQSMREEERTRIAREIHDELGQQLTGLKMDASWIGKKITLEDAVLHKKLVSMISLIDATIITVRRIASELRPGILDDLGLIAALEWQGQEFENRTGIKSYFHNNMFDFNPERELSTTIFRVYQETLTNIIRHAEATEINTIIEKKNDFIILTIKDNGKGFDINEVKYKNSLGLIGMKERALLFRGELIIESQKLKGTSVILKIPLLSSDKKQL